MEAVDSTLPHGGIICKHIEGRAVQAAKHVISHIIWHTSAKHNNIIIHISPQGQCHVLCLKPECFEPQIMSSVISPIISQNQ